MSFAENLKKVRTEKKLTQEQFAELLSVSRQAVSKWESGSGFPETEKLLIISKELGVSLDYLLMDVSPEDKSDRSEKKEEVSESQSGPCIENRKEGLSMEESCQVQDNSVINEAPGKKGKALKRILTALSVVIVLLLIITAMSMLNRSNDLEECKEVIATFFEGYGERDFDGTYETFHPEIREDVKEKALEQNDAADGEEFFKRLDDYLGDMKVEYEYKDETKVSKSELEDILDNISDVYDVELEIEEAYALKVKETYSGENGKQVQLETIVVGRDEDDWYIIAASVDKVLSNSVE